MDAAAILPFDINTASGLDASLDFISPRSILDSDPILMSSSTNTNSNDVQENVNSNGNNPSNALVSLPLSRQTEIDVRKHANSNTNTNILSYDVLHAACREGNLELVKELLQRDDIGISQGNENKNQ